jgi:hypothetical protein
MPTPGGPILRWTGARRNPHKKDRGISDLFAYIDYATPSKQLPLALPGFGVPPGRCRNTARSGIAMLPMIVVFAISCSKPGSAGCGVHQRTARASLARAVSMCQTSRMRSGGATAISGARVQLG